MKTLKDKIVVITGAAKGIGFEDSKLFLQQGTKVAICDFLKKPLIEAGKKLEKYGDVFARVVDVRRQKAVEKFIKEIISHYGKIDILVNNAGILPPRANFSEQSFSTIDDVVDTDLKGILYMARAVINHMLENKSGVIINMSSQAGLEGYSEMTTYCATKFGIRGFSEALNEEVSEQGINVYSICPGPVKTDLNAKFTGQPAEGLPPEKVAELIVKIASTLPRTKTCFEI